MIILDTNVISELTKPQPSPRVLEWFDGVAEPLVLTAITVAELRYGIAALPQGKRKEALSAAVSAMLAEDFAGLVLAFDVPSAEAYGELAAHYRRSGVATGQNDVMIAAIALRHDAAIATRNTRDFAPSGVVLHNPFEPNG